MRLCRLFPHLVCAARHFFVHLLPRCLRAGSDSLVGAVVIAEALCIPHSVAEAFGQSQHSSHRSPPFSRLPSIPIETQRWHLHPTMGTPPPLLEDSDAAPGNESVHTSSDSSCHCLRGASGTRARPESPLLRDRRGRSLPPGRDEPGSTSGVGRASGAGRHRVVLDGSRRP